MIRNETMTEEHHRRPRSLGGTIEPGNISYVTPTSHKHWHTLVGNMNAIQICDHLNRILPMPKGMKLICKFINGVKVESKGEQHSRKSKKIENARKALFKELDFKATIAYINNVWLDPSYHLYIRKK